MQSNSLSWQRCVKPCYSRHDPCRLISMRLGLWSVAIQATGSAATLGAALLVTSTLGLAAQGQFGLLRSWSDALVTIAVLGLPQGLLHLQYRESVPVSTLMPWVVRYVGVVAVACVLLGAVALASVPTSALPSATIAALAASVPLAAAHLLWRALALREVGVISYAAITAAPALLTLAALVPLSLLVGTPGLVWALLAGAALSAALSAWVVHRALRQRACADPVPDWSRATLWSIGAETGMQSVFTVLSPALVLSTVGWLGASLAEVGVISLGLHVYQLFGVAAAYAAPMVYDRAASAVRPPVVADTADWLRARATSARISLAAIAAVMALVLARWLWPTDAALLAMFALMALAGSLSMAVRMLVTLMLARGAFRPLTLQAFVRLLIAVFATALLLPLVGAVLAVPLVLAMTELLLLVWLLRLLRHDGPAYQSKPL